MSGKHLKALIIVGAWLLASSGGWAQEGPGCLDCHKADGDSPVHAIFNTVHGSLQGGGAATCTACHGASEAHDRRGKKAPPDVSFGPLWTSAVETRNTSCQACHKNGDQLLWAGSAHQQENLGCNDCHSAHQPQDHALDARASQPLCLNCHTQVRAELQLPSRHPDHRGQNRLHRLPQPARRPGRRGPAPGHTQRQLFQLPRTISAVHFCGNIRRRRRTAPCVIDPTALSMTAC